jgi:DNA repair exonuclease SbcCD ATPase subunit
MVTARAIAAAEGDLRKAEQAAIHARTALQKASVRDGRLMSLMPSNDPRRRSFEDATRDCMQAERAAHEARAKLDRLRSANGGGRPSVKAARATLATAIEHEKRARSAVKRNQAAIEKARDEARTARAQLEHAEAGAEEAKTETTAAAMAKARSKLTAAEDAAQAAANMRAKLEQKQGELDRAAEDTGRQVQACVDAVIRAELSIGDLLAETARLTERLVTKRLLLRGIGFFETTSAEERRVIQEAVTAPLPGMPAEGHQFEQHPTVLAVKQMRAALAADATAPVERL